LALKNVLRCITVHTSHEQIFGWLVYAKKYNVRGVEAASKTKQKLENENALHAVTSTAPGRHRSSLKSVHELLLVRIGRELIRPFDSKRALMEVDGSAASSQNTEESVQNEAMGSGHMCGMPRAASASVM
jgi:hypothetical protein